MLQFYILPFPFLRIISLLHVERVGQSYCVQGVCSSNVVAKILAKIVLRYLLGKGLGASIFSCQGRFSGICRSIKPIHLFRHFACCFCPTAIITFCMTEMLYIITIVLLHWIALCWIEFLLLNCLRLNTRRIPTAFNLNLNVSYRLAILL